MEPLIHAIATPLITPLPTWVDVGVEGAPAEPLETVGVLRVTAIRIALLTVLAGNKGLAKRNSRTDR